MSKFSGESQLTRRATRRLRRRFARRYVWKMKEEIAKSLSGTTYVASGMLVCALIFCIVNGEYILTKQYAIYLLVILASYFGVNLLLQLFTNSKKAIDSNDGL